MRRIALAILLLLLARQSWADIQSDIRVCTSPPTPNAAVQACTRLIKSGYYEGQILASLYFNRGAAHARSRQHRQAVRDYTQALRLAPKLPDIFNNRGWSYSGLGQHRRAIADYNQALRLKPDFANALANRGYAYAALGYHRRAITDYDKAIGLNPRLAIAYLFRGASYESLGNRSKAADDYKTARRLDPRMGKAVEELKRKGAWIDADKRICLSGSNLKLRLSSCTRLIRSGKLNRSQLAVAYDLRGVVRAELRSYRLALADFDKAVKYNPGFARAHYHRGRALYVLQDNQNAFAAFDQAARLEPTQPLFHNWRGIVLVRLGRRPEAIAALDKAISLAPRAAFLYRNRGIVYRQMGMTRRAIADFSEALGLDPNNAEYYYVLRGNVHAQIGQRQEAIRDYRSALRLRPNYPPAISGLRKLGVAPEQHPPEQYEQPNGMRERPDGGLSGGGQLEGAPRCKDVGGYEAYMKRTGKVCRLD